MSPGKMLTDRLVCPEIIYNLDYKSVWSHLWMWDYFFCYTPPKRWQGSCLWDLSQLWCSDLWRTAGIVALGCHAKLDVSVNQKDNKASPGKHFWTCVLKHSPKIITSQLVNSHSSSGLRNLHLDWTHVRDECTGWPVKCVPSFRCKSQGCISFCYKNLSCFY